MLNRIHFLQAMQLVLIPVILFSFVGCSSLRARDSEATKSSPDWEDPEIVGMNKEPGHCTLIPYLDMEKALEADRKASQFYQSLNGDWKFHWVNKPAERRCKRMGRDTRPFKLADARLRQTDISKYEISVSGESASYSPRLQSGRLLSQKFYYSRRLERPADFPTLRRCQKRLLRLGQRH
jgi:hypothetical protein